MDENIRMPANPRNNFKICLPHSTDSASFISFSSPGGSFNALQLIKMFASELLFCFSGIISKV